MQMKRIYFWLIAVAMAAVSCMQTFDEDGLSVSLETVRYTANGGTKVLTVSSETSWNLIMSEDAEQWLTPEFKSGKRGVTSLRLVAGTNSGIVRRTEIQFVAESGESATVLVIQANPYGDTGEDVVPDPASGISVEPTKPNADESCTIKFAPVEGHELYNYDGDIYVHLGVVVDGEWSFVPANWDENKEKCKMTKVADNSFELVLGPTIRDFFGSGATPVNKIAMVVRSDDGSKQTRPDQFCSVLDEKYEFVPFDPDPVIKKPMSTAAGIELKHGVNIHPDKDSVTFVLYEISKSKRYRNYCYLVGDFNGWERQTEYAMYRDVDAGCWWITVGGLDPDTEYRYQFRLGHPSGSDICVSDPYTELVYDGWNDSYIPSSTYPDLPVFPDGAKELISAFKINGLDDKSYQWEVENFTIADPNNIVIYELLLREFSASKDLQGALNQLDYLENLGINAIELMPVQEFDGNNSWGYNPNHYFALDKAYGTRTMYKKFIDECHKRGIAVIFDVVYDHSTGNNTFAKLWYGSNNVTADNPWFNVKHTCAYGVFHDWNHTDPYVNQMIKKSHIYLIEEFKIDGFRFDLTKGFTQNYGKEESYDAQRVEILTDYYNHIHDAYPEKVVILEHLLDAEQYDLGRAGLKLWKNCNGAYRGLLNNGTNDLSYLRDEKGAPFGTSVGYMESHDEERICAGFTGTLESKSWGICGTMTNWGQPEGNADPQRDIRLVQDGNILVARKVKLKEDDAFKIREANNWNGAQFGAPSSQPVVGQECSLLGGGEDIVIGVAGTYDIWFSPHAGKIWVLEYGEKGSTKPAEPQIDYSANNNLEYAMRRAGGCAAFFLTVPGPKMIWQFGELGYDTSIFYPSGNHDDNIAEKPIPTDAFKNNPYRKSLYNVYSYLLNFRWDNPDFFTTAAAEKFQWYVGGAEKYIYGEGANGRRYAVVGNFSTTAKNVSVDAPVNGPWYVYGEQNGTSYNADRFDVYLQPGDFKLLVNFR